MNAFQFFHAKDIDRIDATDNDDMEYWRTYFGVSRLELESAVEAVGEEIAAVAKYLLRGRSRWVNVEPPIEASL